jgi:hypothetical protein
MLYDHLEKNMLSFIGESSLIRDIGLITSFKCGQLTARLILLAIESGDVGDYVNDLFSNRRADFERICREIRFRAFVITHPLRPGGRADSKLG